MILALMCIANKCEYFASSPANVGYACSAFYNFLSPDTLVFRPRTVNQGLPFQSQLQTENKEF